MLYLFPWTSLVAQMVKSHSANARDPGSIPGSEDPLEKGMATHSNILTWRIPMDRGAWQATAHGITKSQTCLIDSHTHTHTHTYQMGFRAGQW